MPGIFMLDTDICSYIIKENPHELMDVFIAHQYDLICISSITYTELMYGLLNKRSERIERKIEEFISLVQIMDWTDIAARKYAEIKDYLKKTERPSVIWI